MPEPASWVPASAILIVYIDFSALLGSPALRGVETSLIESDRWAQIEEFRELTGMDPLHDVWALVYFTSLADDASARWGVAAYGAFDPERVLENIEARGSVPRGEYRETTLHGVPAFSRSSGAVAADQVLAFPNGTTALYGSAAQVRAMLDTGFGFAPPASEESELSAALKQLTAAETFWAVGKGDGDLEDRVGGSAAGLSVPAFVSFSISARFGSSVKVRARAETSDEDAATKLAEMVRGFAAMSSLQQQSDESLREIVETLEVETLDELVEISFEVDSDWVREYLRGHEPRKGDQSKRRARRP